MPPHLLFVWGDPTALSPSRAVAVVGTRRPSELGRRLAARIAAAVSNAGASVVSGLAVGVDGAAHAAAVAAGVPTIAVLGSGHGRLFPRAHERLAQAIVDGGGAVVSEFFADVGPTKGTFPRRNRLISGLADATVVVEAPLHSGALITASWALEQGRECFLAPGPVAKELFQSGEILFRDLAGKVMVLIHLRLAVLAPDPRFDLVTAHLAGITHGRVVVATFDHAQRLDSGERCLGAGRAHDQQQN